MRLEGRPARGMPKVSLIVDDEPLLRALVRDVQEDIGIAAVLPDIEMPGPFNGLDLAWMVRAMWRPYRWW